MTRLKDVDDALVRVFVLTAFMLVLLSISDSQNTADVTMSCPSLFENNRTYIIQCVVNSTAITQAGCQPPPPYLKMGFTSATQSDGYVCFADYPCDLSGSPERCVRCTSSVNNIYTYSLPIQVSYDVYNGGVLDCLLDCPQSTRNITYAINSTCLSLYFTPRQRDGFFTCPTAWVDEDPVTLTCEVKASSVNPAACPGGSGPLAFGFTPRGGTQRSDCVITSYLDSACDGVFNADGCRCREKTANDTYILEYTFIADVNRYNGGSWACVPTCLYANNSQAAKTIDVTGNCTNVGIVVPQYDGALTCPGTWKDQETMTLTCEVIESSVLSDWCSDALGVIAFDFTSTEGAVTRSCVVSSYRYSACNGIFNADGCRCRERTANDTYILEYRVAADVTRHLGVSWACVPVCLDSFTRPAERNIRIPPNCKNIPFAKTTIEQRTEKATSVTTTTTTRVANATAIVITETTTTSTTAKITVEVREVQPDLANFRGPVDSPHSESQIVPSMSILSQVEKNIPGTI